MALKDIVSFQRGRPMVIQKRILLRTVLILMFVMVPANSVLAETLTVDCTKGETLTKAVERAWLFRCAVSSIFHVGFRGIPHEIA